MTVSITVGALLAALDALARVTAVDGALPLCSALTQPVPLGFSLPAQLLDSRGVEHVVVHASAVNTRAAIAAYAAARNAAAGDVGPPFAERCREPQASMKYKGFSKYACVVVRACVWAGERSEEHTSELQSRI